MDDIDRAQERALTDTAAAIAKAARDIQPGEPGECDLCGEESGRLINGACAPCRDKYKLPWTQLKNSACGHSKNQRNR